MKRRLVVHVGPPKTATTYFQEELLANEAVLAEHGVYLPTAGRSEMSAKAVCHHHLAWELTGSPRFRRDQGGWDALARELRGVDAEVVLLSSELLTSGIFTRGIADALDERLFALGREVTILYAVRDQLSLINSSYAQQAKLLMEVGSFRSYAMGVLERGEADLERQTSRWWSAAGVEFVAVPLSALTGQNPVVALLNAARVDVPVERLSVGPEPVNITLGPIAVEAVRWLRVYLKGLNRSLSDDDLAVRRLHRIAARATNEAGWCDEPFWGWTPQLAAEAARQLGPSNERFAQVVWGTGWPMPLPVDRSTCRATLLTLPLAELDRVQDFVHEMGKRYVTLRRGNAAR